MNFFFFKSGPIYMKDPGPYSRKYHATHFLTQRTLLSCHTPLYDRCIMNEKASINSFIITNDVVYFIIQYIEINYFISYYLLSDS